MFSSPRIAENWRLAREVERSSTSQASRRSKPGTYYVWAINVHICRGVVPGPGMSATYENQALLPTDGGFPFPRLPLSFSAKKKEKKKETLEMLSTLNFTEFFS